LKNREGQLWPVETIDQKDAMEQKGSKKLGN
jgi:hypothetical protein